MNAISPSQLSAAVSAAGFVAEPWSPVASILARHPSEHAGPTTPSPLDLSVLQLLCSAEFVLEVGLVVGGVFSEQRWVHDGETAVLVAVGDALLVQDPMRIGELIERLVLEVARGERVELGADDAFRHGALTLRAVHLGPAVTTAAQPIELIGAPGCRSLVHRGAPDTLEPITADELRMILRVMMADRSLFAEVDDVEQHIGTAEFAAIAVQLGRTSLTRLVTDDLEELDRLVAEGMPLLEARADALQIVELLSEPDEEVLCVHVRRGGARTLHLDLDPSFGLLIELSGDTVRLVETTRSEALDRVRRLLDDDGERTLLHITHLHIESGITIACELRHDGRSWIDPDGDEPQGVIDAVLALPQPSRAP